MFSSLNCHSGQALKNILSRNMSSRTLQSIVIELEKFAPLENAEKWDNVGILIEPNKQRPIRKILLTNDLTERVMEEAVNKQTELIISYHPPIFAPLKRITQSNWKERIVSICLGESIAVYSPHTAWDVTRGGVNDWLASAFPIKDIKPIQPVAVGCSVGAGRIFTTPTPITLAQSIKAVQVHIGLDVHVAMGANHQLNGNCIQTVAVCAGSGASLLKGVRADLYVSGEMGHHELLDATHNNISVILCNHSNSERGFLHEFQPKLAAMLSSDCEIIVSATDEDPLRTHKHFSFNYKLHISPPT